MEILINNSLENRSIFIYPICKSRENRHIRHSAIRALKKTNDEIAEMQLLDILGRTADNYEILYCLSSLYDIGTENAIPHIEKHLTSRTRDIKSVAGAAILEIRKRKESSVHT